ncbi:MAG: hypothetical protein U1F58_15925 [Burkholderiales bacterium]
MSLLRDALDYLLGGPKVGGEDEERLRRWLAAPPAALALPHARARYVVVVPEAGSADGWRERLVAIDAVAVEQGRVSLGAGFAVALQARRTGHAPAGGTGRTAMPAPSALLAFLEFVGKSPLVAFSVRAVRPPLERAVRRVLGVPFRHPWIDLQAVLAAHVPDACCTTLAGWLEDRGLADARNPRAQADPVAVAQLLLVALDAATRAGAASGWDLVERADREGAGNA